MNRSENPRWRRIQEKRKVQERETELAEVARNTDFVDKGIRFVCSLPSDMLEKFQFISR